MAMSFDPAARAEAFRALHNAAGAFVIPNPWDVGSARLLASLGFKALATTSAGFAYSLGTSDGRVSRDDVLAHCRAIVEATELPVSADLEKGFGDSPERSEEHTSELQSLMRISYAVFCLKKKTTNTIT